MSRQPTKAQLLAKMARMEQDVADLKTQNCGREAARLRLWRGNGKHPMA